MSVGRRQNGTMTALATHSSSFARRSPTCCDSTIRRGGPMTSCSRRRRRSRRWAGSRRAPGGVAGEVAERSRVELGIERLSERGCRSASELIERVTQVVRVRGAAAHRTRGGDPGPVGFTGEPIEAEFPVVAAALAAVSSVRMLRARSSANSTAPGGRRPGPRSRPPSTNSSPKPRCRRRGRGAVHRRRAAGAGAGLGGVPRPRRPRARRRAGDAAPRVPARARPRRADPGHRGADARGRRRAHPPVRRAPVAAFGHRVHDRRGAADFVPHGEQPLRRPATPRRARAVIEPPPGRGSTPPSAAPRRRCS